jgi:hypothetical protein
MSPKLENGGVEYVVIIWTTSPFAILRPLYPTLLYCLGYRKRAWSRKRVCFGSDRFTTRMQGRKKGSETIIVSKE